MNQDKMLSQNAAETILSMITVEKRFSTGDRLPNETELAEELNISRTTLREAVKILTAYGVLEIQRGRGTYVTRDTLPQSPGLQSLTAVRSMPGTSMRCGSYLSPRPPIWLLSEARMLRSGGSWDMERGLKKR